MQQGGDRCRVTTTRVEPNLCTWRPRSGTVPILDCAHCNGDGGGGPRALVDGDRDAPRGQPRPQEPAAQGWRRGRTSNEPGDLPTSERSRQSERGRRIARSSVHGGGDDCSLAPDRFEMRCRYNDVYTMMLKHSALSDGAQCGIVLYYTPRRIHGLAGSRQWSVRGTFSNE